MAKLSIWFSCSALILTASCAGSQSPTHGAQMEVAQERLSAETDAPSIFLAPNPAAPAVGFLGKDVRVELAGTSVEGRVPVRIRGAILVRGYVPEDLLTLHTQRHGRLRGTPVYLGPNDPVTVLGPSETPGRLLVRAVPRLGDVVLPTFEGTYPAVGLAAKPAVEAAEPPPGEPYQLPAETELALFDQPDGKVVATLPAAAGALPLRVLSNRAGWFAVRIGTGPHLVGYTKAALVPATDPTGAAVPAGPPAAPNDRGLPKRLAQEGGELRRVAAGARVSFGSSVIARLQAPGFARVLATYPSGEVDALVAVDDEVTVRGLVRAQDLTPLEASGSAAQ